MRIAVNVFGKDERTLAFVGFALVRENDEFRIYRDKYHEDHIISKDKPFIIVDSEFDADILRSNEIFDLSDDDDD